jgi:hypothetical protein
MPVPPSIRNSIQAIRQFIAAGGGKSITDLSPYRLVDHLFQNPGRILDDAETLDAVLTLAPEIDAYRGKGSQVMYRDFNARIGGLVFHARLEASEPPPSADLFSETTDLPGPAAEEPYWVAKLSDYFFPRVQGKPVRSQLAGRVRSEAWAALGDLCDFRRLPDHLSQALKTAADERRSDEEREGAIQFLVSYWADEDPDEATVGLLEKLRKNPPNRSFLVSVLQAQIELGLNDEFGALCDVDDWDDAEDEGEEE